MATGTGGAWTGTEDYFSFALVQGATVLWNNWEGIASPSDPGAVSLGAGQVLTLPVNQGVFSLRLGEGSDVNEQIPPTVFFDTVSNSVRSGVKLAVWFSPDGGTFTRLSPDVEFSSVPYAMVSGIAETLKERAVTTEMLADGAVSPSRIQSGWGVVPTGTVVPFAGAVAPTGWVLCDGASLLDGADPLYAELFAVIGTTYGAGIGSQFRVPDLRGRVVAGRDSMGGAGIGRLTNSGGGNPGINGNVLGASGGLDRIALQPGQLASHVHGPGSFSISGGAHGHPGSFLRRATGNGGGSVLAFYSATNANGEYNGNNNVGPLVIPDSPHTHPPTDWSGTSAANTPNGEAHPNTQPTIILNYIIKL